MKTRHGAAAFLALVLSCLMSHVSCLFSQETTVGMTGTLTGLVLPGTELEAVPATDRSKPVVVEAVKAYPHGTAFRYDIRYSVLDPGTFDLRPYLRRRDGTPTTDLPPIPVTATTLLPPGQVQPQELTVEGTADLGGYARLKNAVIVGWVVGLVVIVYVLFLRRGKKAKVATSDRPLTLADRLRPLVEGAVAGRLSQAELAGLERGLHALWRKRLDLETADPARAINEMRRHAEAGPLLDQLERWLHRPGAADPVDVAALLRPYHNLPPDAAEVGG